MTTIDMVPKTQPDMLLKEHNVAVTNFQSFAICTC